MLSIFTWCMNGLLWTSKKKPKYHILLTVAVGQPTATWGSLAPWWSLINIRCSRHNSNSILPWMLVRSFFNSSFVWWTGLCRVAIHPLWYLASKLLLLLLVVRLNLSLWFEIFCNVDVIVVFSCRSYTQPWSQNTQAKPLAGKQRETNISYVNWADFFCILRCYFP